MTRLLNQLIILTLSISNSLFAMNNKNEIKNVDNHTLSNYSQIRVSHVHLDLTVDFSQKELTGFAALSFQKQTETNTLVLDTKYLLIDRVEDQNEHKLDFNYLETDELLGTPLSIQLNDSCKLVKVFYKTTAKSEALDWLSSNQTAGKNFPFMYTQGQSIFTRSWIPIQDTPGIRVTYSADITVPDGMLAVMSASNPQQTNSSNRYHFEMKQSISPYLIALAVGELSFQSIDERTGVYAEPSMIESCANELVDMGKMVDEAEKLYGQYDWDRYDVIVLPPSFPFGGMENPRLTFATPTIIAGDRSLVSLIAHELAHSWSGNLVTNATWNDFWLNEGFTVYFERRIMEALYGKDYTDMLALLGFQDLTSELSSLDEDMQKLKLKLNGLHPDDAMSDIAYEKGYFFLRMLEEKKGRAKMDSFLKNYFDDHKFQTITTEEFLAYLDQNLLQGEEDGLMINQWVYQSGLPANCPKVLSNRFVQAEKAVDVFLKKGVDNIVDAAADWSTHEWLHFIKHLPENINKHQLEKLDETFNLSLNGNAEILCVWFLISIKADYQPAFDPMKIFLTKIGRRKFLQPIYEELAKKPANKTWAKQVYEKARDNYHYVSFNTIDGILKD